MATKAKRMTRQESQEQTRERLLLAAQVIFLREGYGGAKIEDITAEAGLTRGAFYSNFERKDEVLMELLRRDEKSFLEPASRLFEETFTQDQLKSAALLYFGKLFSKNELFPLWAEARLLAGRDAKFSECFNTFMEDERRQVVQVLEFFAVKAGIPLPMPANILALGLISLVEGVQAYYTSDPSQMTEQVAEHILGEFLARVMFGHGRSG